MSDRLPKKRVSSPMDILIYAAIPAIVFICLLSWRPFFLGFYHDDWYNILRPLSYSERDEFINQITRPLYWAGTAFLRRTIFDSPVAWHTVLAALVTLNAVAIGAVGHRLAALISDDRDTARWSMALCASVWLALPWALGLTVWPTPTVGQLAITCFCGVALALLSEAPLRNRLYAGGGLFLLGQLINELFWFSFIPLLIINAAADRTRYGAVRWRHIGLLAGGFLALQAFPLVANRALHAFGIGINRSFNPNWFDTIFLSLRLLPQEVNRAVVYPQAFWAVLAVLFAAIVYGLATHRNRLLIFACLIAVIAGGVGSAIMFALAGYRLESVGVFSRTMSTASVWFSLLPALVLGAVGSVGRLGRRAAILGLCALITILGISAQDRLAEWVASWERQKALLAFFPGEKLADTASPNAFIVVYLPKQATAVEGFEAFWDMTGALMNTFPRLQERLAPEQVRYFATAVRADRHHVKWDGAGMTTSWCAPAQGELWRLPAEGELYVWEAETGRLHRYDQSVDFGCGVPPPKSGS